MLGVAALLVAVTTLDPTLPRATALFHPARSTAYEEAKPDAPAYEFFVTAMRGVCGRELQEHDGHLRAMARAWNISLESRWAREKILAAITLEFPLRYMAKLGANYGDSKFWYGYDVQTCRKDLRATLHRIASH